MKNIQTDLMSFRVPSIVRSNFSKICRLNHTTMTFQIIQMMKHFIEFEGDKIIDSISKNDRIEERLNIVVERS